MTNDVPIRDAATVILLRDAPSGPQVLMGQRGAKAVFMPSKYVFPGGALDADDALMSAGTDLRPDVASALCEDAPEGIAHALAHAAVRELWEEAGQRLAVPGEAPADVPADWATFVEGGWLPALGRLDFIFRAVTPPGRPRRFDARFFLVHAEELSTDPDDFTHACDELSHLHWIGLGEVRSLALPFITEIVLAEVDAIVAGTDREQGVPFYKHGAMEARFKLLRG